MRFGKPFVKNTRITVYVVLGWFASGVDKIEIIEYLRMDLIELFIFKEK